MDDPRNPILLLVNRIRILYKIKVNRVRIFSKTQPRKNNRWTIGLEIG
jgi:hypothetical protein